MDPIRLENVELFGSNLKRPEGVMVARDGTVWCSDGGGVARIRPGGQQDRLGDLGGEPNGICLDRDGSLIIANIGGGAVQRLHLDGRHEIITRTMDGRPMTAPNFPFLDKRGRLWVTNSTPKVNYRDALRQPDAGGCLCLIEGGKTRILAEGLRFANGVALDERERYVYVAETYGLRVVRYEIRADGSVGPLEPYGPELGAQGYTDGIAFDSAGNLWVTLPTMNAVGYIDPKREWHLVLHDEKKEKLKRPTNICFGGADLRTAYVGSLDGTSLPRFRVPYPGMPLVHQM